MDPVSNLPLPAPPVGLSTKVGLAGSAAFAIAAGVAAVVHGDHTPETIGGIAGAAVVLYGVIQSRGKQAAALYDSPVTRDLAEERAQARWQAERAAIVDSYAPGDEDPDVIAASKAANAAADLIVREPHA